MDVEQGDVGLGGGRVVGEREDLETVAWNMYLDPVLVEAMVDLSLWG